MSLITTAKLELSLAWPADAANGRWLDTFIAILTLLPSKVEPRAQVMAFSRLWEVAADFLYDELDPDPDSDRRSAEWTAQVTMEARWDQNSLTNNAFKHYAANGRKIVMSYREAVAYVRNHRTTLFGPIDNDGAFQETEAYLKRLKDLRSALHAFTQYLDLTQPLHWTAPISGKTYTYNPLELYEEFQSHYAYETALCLPMY